MKSINPEIDGVDGSQFNYYDPANPKSGKVFVNNRAPYVDPNPGHSYEGNN
jgi:phospholipase C